MSQRIRKYITYLQLLHNTHRSQQKALLNTITLEQLKAISEIALNILHGVIPLKALQKKALTPYRKFIRMIGQKKGSLIKKKTILLKNIKALGVLLKSGEALLKTL